MAVSYANALQKKVSFSGIVVTRNEGSLQNQLDKDVPYLFLAKKKVLDLKALFKLRSFLKVNNIQFIQAHSTSIYFAFLLKLVLPSIKIIWHDHYGKSEMLNKRKSFVLRIISVFVFGIVAVNQKLAAWSLNNLFCKKVIYLANFTVSANETSFIKTKLKGTSGKQIVCLANLRPQKNHILLLEVAEKCKINHPYWSFHLVGKDFQDSYSNMIRNLIVEKGLQEKVFLYGSCDDVTSILQQCQIGILTSDSEGLPVALLEYGFQELAVISTAVGEIPAVIDDKKSGLLVRPKDTLSFSDALTELIENDTLRISLGENLKTTILNTYSEEKVMLKYINWVNEK